MRSIITVTESRLEPSPEAVRPWDWREGHVVKTEDVKGMTT